MSSRLAYDERGRLICVDADGHRWVVLGNLVCSLVAGELVLFGWLGRSGRPATARERAEARARTRRSACRRGNSDVRFPTSYSPTRKRSSSRAGNRNTRQST
jgi:hypothetical protein